MLGAFAEQLGRPAPELIRRRRSLNPLSRFNFGMFAEQTCRAHARGMRRKATDTRLFEHQDFEDAVLHAEEHFRDQGIRAALIEKDYFVTEALRIIADRLGDRVIFKGGTSLSKGWGLIRRFSEDVDRPPSTCPRGADHSMLTATSLSRFSITSNWYSIR